MYIRLGNVQFHQVENVMGYRLTEKDKSLWDKFHDDNANLANKETGFHIFDTPKSIVFKGEDAKAAIIEMFSPDKLVESRGRFSVFSL